MRTEAAKRAAKKYDQENTVKVSLKLNKKYDDDIIKRLEKVENKQKYIKRVVRHEIYFNHYGKDDKNDN